MRVSWSKRLQGLKQGDVFHVDSKSRRAIMTAAYRLGMSVSIRTDKQTGQARCHVLTSPKRPATVHPGYWSVVLRNVERGDSFRVPLQSRNTVINSARRYGVQATSHLEGDAAVVTVLSTDRERLHKRKVMGLEIESAVPLYDHDHWIGVLLYGREGDTFRVLPTKSEAVLKRAAAEGITVTEIYATQDYTTFKVVHGTQRVDEPNGRADLVDR